MARRTEGRSPSLWGASRRGISRVPRRTGRCLAGASAFAAACRPALGADLHPPCRIADTGIRPPEGPVPSAPELRRRIGPQTHRGSTLAGGDLHARAQARRVEGVHTGRGGRIPRSRSGSCCRLSVFDPNGPQPSPSRATLLAQPRRLSRGCDRAVLPCHQGVSILSVRRDEECHMNRSLLTACESQYRHRRGWWWRRRYPNRRAGCRRSPRRPTGPRS